MYYNAKDKLPSPAVNGYSNGCRGNIILMQDGNVEIAQAYIFYDHNESRWLDWGLSKEEHKPVLAEQINDKVVQRVIDWEYINADSYLMTEDFWNA